MPRFYVQSNKEIGIVRLALDIQIIRFREAYQLQEHTGAARSKEFSHYTKCELDLASSTRDLFGSSDIRILYHLSNEQYYLIGTALHSLLAQSFNTPIKQLLTGHLYNKIGRTTQNVLQQYSGSELRRD